MEIVGGKSAVPETDLPLPLRSPSSTTGFPTPLTEDRRAFFAFGMASTSSDRKFAWLNRDRYAYSELDIRLQHYLNTSLQTSFLCLPCSSTSISKHEQVNIEGRRGKQNCVAAISLGESWIPSSEILGSARCNGLSSLHADDELVDGIDAAPG
jgi:hypothetical protein